MLQKEEILSAYPWMDNALFTRIIKKDYPNAKIETKDFTVKAALGPGENYASHMIRASVNYQINGENVKKNFIIKAALIKQELQDLISEHNLFEKEIRMYREIIPELEKLLQAVGDNTKFAAKCYDCSNEKQYIIFEDLSINGYRNVNRRLGLNVDQYKFALNKIAKFHACTAVLQSKNYSFNKMDEPTVTMEFIQSLSFNTLRAAAEFVKKLPNWKHLSDKLLKTVHTVIPRTKDALLFKSSDFVTLCHGDLWMNNIMFKFNDEGCPIDALLVDYQIPYVGPAVMDVINALYTSSEENIQDREWDILLQYYHRVLSDTMQKLNYSKPIPTLTSIQMQVLEKGVCYMPMSLMCPGVRTMESQGEDIMTFSANTDESVASMVRIMSGPKALKTFEFLLDYFDRKGYFE